MRLHAPEAHPVAAPAVVFCARWRKSIDSECTDAAAARMQMRPRVR